MHCRAAEVIMKGGDVLHSMVLTCLDHIPLPWLSYLTGQKWLPDQRCVCFQRYIAGQLQKSQSIRVFCSNNSVPFNRHYKEQREVINKTQHIPQLLSLLSGYWLLLRKPKNLLIKLNAGSCMVVYAWNHCTQKAEAEWAWVQGQPVL
jgi:hypothetical protein